MRTALPATSGAPAAREKAWLAKRRKASTSAGVDSAGMGGTSAQYRQPVPTAVSGSAKAREREGREVHRGLPAESEAGDDLAGQRADEDSVAIQTRGMEQARQRAGAEDGQAV